MKKVGVNRPHSRRNTTIAKVVGVFSTIRETRWPEPVGCANLMAWCSGPRGSALTRDVLLLDAVRLCAGVPARSTVRRDGDEIWV
ncbi:unnamed protein product [Prunus armeniaca]